MGTNSRDNNGNEKKNFIESELINEQSQNPEQQKSMWSEQLRKTMHQNNNKLNVDFFRLDIIFFQFY